MPRDASSSPGWRPILISMRSRSPGCVGQRVEGLERQSLAQSGGLEGTMGDFLARSHPAPKTLVAQLQEPAKEGVTIERKPRGGPVGPGRCAPFLSPPPPPRVQTMLTCTFPCLGVDLLPSLSLPAPWPAHLLSPAIPRPAMLLAAAFVAPSAAPQPILYVAFRAHRCLLRLLYHVPIVLARAVLRLFCSRAPTSISAVHWGLDPTVRCTGLSIYLFKESTWCSGCVQLRHQTNPPAYRVVVRYSLASLPSYIGDVPIYRREGHAIYWW